MGDMDFIDFLIWAYVIIIVSFVVFMIALIAFS